MEVVQSKKLKKKIKYIKIMKTGPLMSQPRFVQLQINTFQGLFKDFSRTNYRFSRTKIYLINRHSLTSSLPCFHATRPGPSERSVVFVFGVQRV